MKKMVYAEVFENFDKDNYKHFEVEYNLNEMTKTEIFNDIKEKRYHVASISYATEKTYKTIYVDKKIYGNRTVEKINSDRERYKNN